MHPGGRIRSRWGCTHKTVAVSSFLHNSRTICRKRQCPLSKTLNLMHLYNMALQRDYWPSETHFGSQPEEQFASLLWTEQVWNCGRHQWHKIIELVIIQDVSPLSHLPHCCREQPQRRDQQSQWWQRQEYICAGTWTGSYTPLWKCLLVMCLKWNHLLICSINDNWWKQFLICVCLLMEYTGSEVTIVAV